MYEIAMSQESHIGIKKALDEADKIMRIAQPTLYELRYWVPLIMMEIGM